MPAGMDVVVALSKGSAWGTAASVNAANKGFPLRTLPISFGIGPNLIDDTMGGGGFAQDIVQGNIDVSGTPGAWLRYGDAENLAIALAMGSTTTPIQQGTTTAWLHTFNLASTLDGLYATLAALKGTSVYEWPSLKIHGFTMTWRGGGERAEITFDAIAYPAKLSTDAADLPTNTTLAAVTTFSPRPIVQGFHTVIRMNAVSGAALAAPTDVIEPNEVIFRYQRPMSGEFFVGGGRAISEPTLDNVPTIQVTLNYGTYQVAAHDALFAAAKAGTEYKMDITMTHPSALAGTAFPYKIIIRIPRMALGQPDNAATGPGKIPFSITMDAMKPTVASAGMSGLLTPFDYQAYSTHSASFFA
jgi:hypothetical protein